VPAYPSFAGKDAMKQVSVSLNNLLRSCLHKYKLFDDRESSGKVYLFSVSGWIKR